MMDLLRSPECRDALTGAMPILLGLNILIILGLTWLGRSPRPNWGWGLTKTPRGTLGAMGIPLLMLLGVALILRVVVLPLGNHVFDGHEADYFDAFRQIPLPESMGYRFYPALASLYRGLGWALGGGEFTLLGVSIALSLLTIPLSGLFVHRLSGRPAAGAIAAVLVAMDPIHAFWSSSAYNVMLPFLCLLLGALALESGCRHRSPQFGAGLAWVALAFSFRMESAMVLLPLGAMVLLSIKDVRTLRRLSFLSLPGVGLFILHALAMGLALKRPPGADSPFDYAQLHFSLQWDYLALLRPYDHPLLLALTALTLALALWATPRSRGMALVLMLGWLPLHLAYAAFDDYGTRHTLWMRLAPIGFLSFGIAFLSEALVSKGPQWGPRALQGIGLGVIIAISAPTLGDVRQRYYASPQAFLEDEAAFKGAEHILVEPLASRCVFVSESGFYAKYDTASHFELLEPRRFDALKSRGDGCVLYVYDLENYQMSSRSIHERALKVMAFMELELKGKRLRPDLEDYALIFEVKGPK